MKSIYLLLTKSDTYVSRIINLVTTDPYTHISISFEDSLQPLYSFSRKYVYSPLPAGIRHEPLDSGFFKKYNYIPCALYELRVDDDIYIQAKQRVLEMMDDPGKYKFNVLGLVLCKLNIPYNRERYFFCSEFVSVILEDSHAVHLPKCPCLMRPYDYTKLKELNCLFEGRLNELVLQVQPSCLKGALE